jgi:hypothetical protein
MINPMRKKLRKRIIMKILSRATINRWTNDWGRSAQNPEIIGIINHLTNLPSGLIHAKKCKVQSLNNRKGEAWDSRRA